MRLCRKSKSKIMVILAPQRIQASQNICAVRFKAALQGAPHQLARRKAPGHRRSCIAPCLFGIKISCIGRIYGIPFAGRSGRQMIARGLIGRHHGFPRASHSISMAGGVSRRTYLDPGLEHCKIESKFDHQRHETSGERGEAICIIVKEPFEKKEIQSARELSGHPGGSNLFGWCGSASSRSGEAMNSSRETAGEESRAAGWESAFAVAAGAL
jgi:hypothetical protein